MRLKKSSASETFDVQKIKAPISGVLVLLLPCQQLVSYLAVVTVQVPPSLGRLRCT